MPLDWRASSSKPSAPMVPMPCASSSSKPRAGSWLSRRSWRSARLIRWGRAAPRRAREAVEALAGVGWAHSVAEVVRVARKRIG